MKTIREALTDEVYYPIPRGYVDNVLIKRKINGEIEFTWEVAQGAAYKGAVADCLCSLIQTITISEADKSFGSLSEAEKKLILQRANRLYSEIGESEIVLERQPKVFMGDAVWR